MILPSQRSALEHAISPDRLGTYRTEALRSGRDELELYVWDRDVAAAAIADIAIVEVAMRNAMNRALERLAGQADWYVRDVGLDNRSNDALTAAWAKVPVARRTPGRVIAQLMFGFWRNLLEAGGDVGKGPSKRTADYEALWRSHLHTAFPGGRIVAAARGARFTRTWTLDVVKDVHALRNRAAHHEPLINGFPMPGENRRIDVPRALQSCFTLAEILDRELAGWLMANSHLAATLQDEPN